MNAGLSQDPLAAAGDALLVQRRRIDRDEALAVAALPLDELAALCDLAHRVRLEWCGPAVELETLVNVKSGACPEDCTFCGQSARYQTDVDVYPLLDVDSVLGAARETEANGVAQFCFVAAERAPSDRAFERLLDCIRAVRSETGLDIGCSLGLVTPEQAGRLYAAGVRCFNHNLETCRELFPQICTTHTYDDRVATARVVKAAGLELCCGGILGVGETLTQRVDLAFELAALEPHEVPINFLNPRPGTPLGDRGPMDGREALQAVALFRLILPDVWLRIAGGRELVLGELQSQGMLSGANGLIVGNYLTTIGRPPEADLEMLASLGMPIAAPAGSDG